VGNLKSAALALTEILMRPPRARVALFGALGALYGSGAMTLGRLVMRRAGHLDKTVPQTIEEWALHELDVPASGDGPRHFAVDQLLHVLYGMLLGAAASPALFAGRQRRPLWLGSTFGLATWAVGALGIFPLLRIARPAWKSSTAENLTNIATHVVFGLAVQILAEEAVRERFRGAASDTERHLARVG
jgi:hypothetical protein